MCCSVSTFSEPVMTSSKSPEYEIRLSDTASDSVSETGSASSSSLLSSLEIIAAASEIANRPWYIRFFKTPIIRTKEERAFVRKLDFFLMTWACSAYLIKSIDQSNYSNAYVSGMREDLNIVGNQYNWISSWFTIGYAIGLIPSQFVLMKIKAQYWLSSCEFLWGVLTLICAFVPTVQGLYPLRFCVGLLESSSWPGVMTIFCNYYTEGELPTRAALFTASSFVGGMFTGFMQASIHTTMNGKGGLAGWQWLFVMNGIMTVVVADFGFYILPDPPEDGGARWMTQKDLKMALSRIQRSGMKTKRDFNLR